MIGVKGQSQDILFVTHRFPDDASLHGRAVQTLIASCLAQDIKVTILSLGPEKKDVWHKGKCHHICLGSKNTESGAISTVRAKFKMAMALHGLATQDITPPRLVITDGTIGRLVFSVHKWAQKYNVTQIHWASKIYPEAARFEGEKGQAALAPRIYKAYQKQMRKMMKTVRYSVVESLPIYKYLSHNGVDTRRMKIISSWGLIPLKTGAAAKAKKIGTKTKPSAKTSLMAASRNLKQDPINQKFRVLLSGEILHGKSWDTIIAAAKFLEVDYPEIEFVLSGYGAGMDDFSAQRALKGLHNIKLMPLQPKVNYIGFLESGDVHLVVEEEGSPLVGHSYGVEQALLVNRPIILMAAGKSHKGEEVKKKKMGRVVKLVGEKELIDALLQYRQDSDYWIATHENLKAMEATPRDGLKEWRDLIKKELS